jgi:hypothetical protein
MDMVQEDTELIVETAAERIGRDRNLLLHDAIIFQLLSGYLEPLPRKGTTKEVHEAQGMQKSESLDAWHAGQ